MIDPFEESFPLTNYAPAEHAFAADAEFSDANDLGYATRALYVGTQGNLKVVTVQEDTVTFVGIQGILPVRVKQIYSTGTTASDVIGLY